MLMRLKTHNELSCLAQGQGTMFAKKGSMVAYQGQFKFEKVLLDPNGGGLVSSAVNHVMRRATGENMELMKIKGQGDLYLADEAQHVSTIDLQMGDTLSVESENLLAFNEAVKYGVRFIGVGVISQKGLFTSKFTATGQGAQVAVKTDGNPIILQTPCVVDPDAVVAWSGPDPSFKVDVNWKTLLGQTSGESYMLEFKQPGGIVIIQPSERLSGLKIGIDDKRYTPQSQNSAFQNTMNGAFNNNQNSGNINSGGNINTGGYNNQGQGQGLTGNSTIDGVINNFLNRR